MSTTKPVPTTKFDWRIRDIVDRRDGQDLVEINDTISFIERLVDGGSYHVSSINALLNRLNNWSFQVARLRAQVRYLLDAADPDTVRSFNRSFTVDIKGDG